MRKLTLDEFIIKANIKHDNFYDYSKVNYVNNNVKIQIVCPYDGDFWQTPGNHTSGKGCPKCKGRKISKSLSKGNEKFIQDSIQIHGNLYDYSLVEYINWTTPVSIICKKHGVFNQTPSVHTTNMCGCPKCANNNKMIKNTKSENDFIIDARNKHNDLYYYNLTEYVSSTKKVVILCSKHGEFKQTPNSHLNGSGCPKCVSSRGEISIRTILSKNNIQFKEQMRFSDCKNIKSLPFDFYISGYNICIEYDGEQHYIENPHRGGKDGFERTKLHDSIKNEFCLNNKIKLFRIRYDENVYDKMREIMEYINEI